MLTIVKKNIKFIKTCNLYLSMFSLGLSLSLTGPCLLDLQRLVNTDIQHIALIYTARSTGYLIGAILSGILLDLLKYKQAVLTICNFLITASLFGIPWSRNVDMLLGFAVVNGMSLGAIETGSNVICLQLWKSGPIFQGLHFTFGLGGLVSPLIAAPFLDSRTEADILNNNTSFIVESGMNATSNQSSETLFQGGVANITYPFSFIGTVGLLVTILFLAVSIISPTEEEESQSEKEGQSSQSCCFMFTTVTLIILIFFVITGTEIGYAQTLTTYAVKGRLHVTAARGSYITSAYWASFTFFRLVCTFLAIKISDMTLVICDIIIYGVSALMLLFFMPNESILWAASIIFGAGIASSYPSLVGWVGNYINITNKISSIFVVGCAAGEMVVPFIIAYFMETLPEMFAYVTAASCVLVTILLTILYLVFRIGNKKKTSNKTECNVISSGVSA